MTTGPVTARSRHALSEFTRLLADRAGREADLASSLAASRQSAEADHAAARSAAAAALERDTAAAHARATESHAQTVAPLEVELGRVEDARRAAAAALNERAALDEAAIAKWLADKVWLAESLFETNAPKPGDQFEATRRDLAGTGARLRQVETAAATFLRAAHMGTLPTMPPPAGAGAWTEAESSRRLAEATAATEELAARLAAATIARLFVAPWPLLLALALALAGGAAAFGLGWHDGRSLAFGAGAGAGASVILLALLFLLARRRIAQPVAALALALAEARAAGERWLEIAGDTRHRAELRIKETRDTDIKSAQVKAAARRDELTKVRAQRLATLDQEHGAAAADLRQRRDAAAASLEDTRTADLAAASEQHARALAQADATRARALAGAQAAAEEGWSALAHDWSTGMAAAHAQARGAINTVAPTVRPWSDPLWQREDQPGGWSPPPEIPAAVGCGTLHLDLSALPGGLPADPRLADPGPAAISLPIALELPDRCSLLIRSPAPGRSAALALLQAAMLRLLTGFPPGKVRFTIVDPVGLGQNFAAFMHLADYEPALVSDRIWTEPRHIEQRLTDLTEHMENVIQKYLRNQFRTIEDYNVHAGEVAEPYRFLVIADLPTGFNELAAKRLASILDSGPRCGVYTLMLTDPRQPLPQGLTRDDLAKAALQLSWRASGASGGGAFSVDDPLLGTLPLTVEGLPESDLFNRLVHMVGRHAKDSSRVQVPFEMIAPPMEQGEAGLWPLSSAKSIRVPMGRAGATKLQHMVLGVGTGQHALIAGRTGSGKSTLFHAIITSLATWYGPGEIELYLVDFKKGVEFKTYATHQVPHARVIAIESEREFGLSVLRRLDAELKRRGDLFRAAEVQDIASFREKNPGERMPRIMLIVDEFQELFVEDDKLAQESSLLLDRLVRQGRAFGMHAVLGSQTLGGAYSLARSTIGQMAVRVALQCSEADSYLILSDDNPAARLLSRPGEAIYNDASGAVEGNNPFQVAWLPEDKREKFLDLVQSRQARALANGSPRPVPPIIFEGSAPAQIERNGELADLRAGRAKPRVGTLLAWIGEPIAIKDPTAGVFRRQSAANLLIVGQKDESALAMFATSLVSLASQTARAAGNAALEHQFLILDGTPADAPTAGYFERAALAVGPAARLVPYREVDATLAALAAELDRRAASDASDGPPVFLLVYGLQRFRSLRRPENEFDFGSADGAAAGPDKLFLRILREGPALGIHALVWCDTVSSFNRTLERSALREFDQRVLFQMSASDSSALIDVASAGLIGSNRALFYSEEQGTIEKFRPYALPEQEWLSDSRAVLGP